MEVQIDQVSFYWISLYDGRPTPLTVRIISRQRDLHIDLAGGNRIPKIGQRVRHEVSPNCAAGVGADRIFFVHDGSSAGHDLFQSILTTIDPAVSLTVAHLPPPAGDTSTKHDFVLDDLEQARHLSREVDQLILQGEVGPGIIDAAKHEGCDLLVLLADPEGRWSDDGLAKGWTKYVVDHAPCPILLAVGPPIPDLAEVE